jgi:hypothetical protein
MAAAITISPMAATAYYQRSSYGPAYREGYSTYYGGMGY